jgi:hypothetical protein
MATVRSGESVKYGVKLFAYFLVVVLLGGGGLGLGLVLAVPEARALVGSGIADKSVLAGGAVLAFLGAAILISGLFGLLYKLLGDAVAAGVAGGGRAAASEMPASPPAGSDNGNGDSQPAESPAGKSTGAREAPPNGETAKEPANGRPDSETSADEWTETPSEEEEGESQNESAPREPSPEEIAFGSDEDEERENEGGNSNDVTPAGSSSAGDPLADPTEDE